MRLAISDRVASTRKNNLLYNGDFEVKPSFVAATNTALRWIDGTAAGSQARRGYGWGIPSAAVTNAEAAFDTAVKNSGTASMRLSILATNGVISVTNYRNAPAAGSPLSETFILSPNTQYTVTGYISTNNVITNGAWIDFREYNAAATALITNSTTKFSGTAGFQKVTLTVTTQATTVFGTFLLRLNAVGNVISDAWFDDITLVPTVIGRVAS